MTIGECDRAMRKMRSRVREAKRHRDITPYHCNACQGWHCTGMTSAAERDRVHIRDKDDRQTRKTNNRLDADKNSARFERAGTLGYSPA